MKLEEVNLSKLDDIGARVGVEPIKGDLGQGIFLTTPKGNSYDAYELLMAVLNYIDAAVTKVHKPKRTTKGKKNVTTNTRNKRLTQKARVV